MAPSIFKRNIKLRRMPISAWNFRVENIQVETPKARVIPVKTTALPVFLKASRKASSKKFSLLKVDLHSGKKINSVVHSYADSQCNHWQGVRF